MLLRRFDNWSLFNKTVFTSVTLDFYMYLSRLIWIYVEHEKVFELKPKEFWNLINDNFEPDMSI